MSAFDATVGEVSTGPLPHMRAFARVLKKHVYSKQLMFLDVVYANPDFPSDWVEFTGPYLPPTHTNKKSYYEFASLVIKRTVNVDEEEKEEEKAVYGEENVIAEISEESTAAAVPSTGEEAQTMPSERELSSSPLAVTAGDVIHFDAMIQNLENFTTTHDQRPSLFAMSHQVTVVQTWQSDRDGCFAFEPLHFSSLNQQSHQSTEPFNFATAGALSFSIPSLIVQCKRQMVPRVLAVLSLIVREIDPLAHVRESVVSLVKSSDRLLLLWTSAVDISAVIRRLTTHPVLSTAIMRLYTAQHSQMSFSCASARLDEVSDGLNAVFPSLQSSITGVRLQSFPRHVTPEVIAHSPESFPWTPRNASHTLSLTLCDGLWMLSLAEVQYSFVGDLREAKAVDVVNHDAITVCRAQAKLEEAMRRRGWLPSADAVSPDGYRFAIDVGASPGGWSLCMATLCHADRVLSVDKGLLSLQPWPQNVVHWRVLGDEAIDRLIAQREGRLQSMIDAEGVELDVKTFEEQFPSSVPIDLFCCDANIPPETTVGMVLRCIQHNLLSENARVVLTFKNVYRRKTDWDQRTPQCIALLQEHGLVDIQTMHLLANTQRETTITGVYRRSLE